MSLTNTQYDTIMRQYEAIRIRNRHLLEQRKAEVYERLPQLPEIDASICGTSLAHARRLLEGDDSALPALHEQLAALAAQKASLLSGAGYPADYLDMPYQCPDCQDTGYCNGVKCHCFRQAAIDLVYTQSNIRNILEQENFSTFSFAYYSKDALPENGGVSAFDAAHAAVKACRSFIQDFDSAFGNLFLYGSTGVGKTFLSNCVARELLDSGHSVIYFTAAQLFQLLEAVSFHRDEVDSSSCQNLFDCDLLIIDDLGTEFATSFTTSQLFLCLNERLLRRKSTIISTNLNISQLVELYSERTFSRITSSYTMVKLVGADIRILKKMQRL